MTPGLTRETYRAISLYAPNRAPAEIDLSDLVDRNALPQPVRR